MKNTEAYFNWHYIISVVIGLIIASALIDGNYGNLILTVPLLIPVGIVQLITGIDYFLQDLPDEFAGGWRTYWSITAIYFVILLLLYRANSVTDLFWFWLCAAPWFITVYQFTIVQRIYKWKSSKADDSNTHIHSKS